MNIMNINKVKQLENVLYVVNKSSETEPQSQPFLSLCF